MASCSLQEVEILEKSKEFFDIVASLDINNPEDQKLLREIEEKLNKKNNTENTQSGGKCDNIQNTLKATAVLAAVAVSLGACYYNYKNSVLSYISPENLEKLKELCTEFKKYYKDYDDNNKYSDPISYYLSYIELPIKGYTSLSSAICKILFNDAKLEEITEVLKEQRRVKKGRKSKKGKKKGKKRGNKKF